MIDKQGNVSAFNSVASSSFGLPIAEAIGKPYQQMLSLDFVDRETLRRTGENPIEQALLGKFSKDEFLAAYKNGDLHFSLSVTPVNLEDDPQIVLTLYPVSWLIAKQQYMLAAKEHLHLLVSSLDDIVLEITSEGLLLNHWTSNPDQLFYDPAYFTGKNISELFPAALSDEFLSLVRTALSQRHTVEMKYASPLSSHENRWYNLQIKPIKGLHDRVIAVISDITINVHAQEQISILEQKFNKAFEHSGIGMALVSLEGKCIDVNRTLCKILGYSADELRAKSFPEYTHPDDLDMDISLGKQLVEGTRESYSLEKRYRHKQGHYVWCLLTLSMVTDSSQNPVFLVAQVQDLSILKGNMEILERQKNQLETAMVDLESKVRQLEEFDQIVAHNLRGPASNIQMLIREMETATSALERTTYFELLHASSENLIQILQELIEILEVRNSRSLPVERCYFAPIFEQIEQQFTKEISTTGAVIIYDLDQPDVWFPKVYLESILHNLMSNALKFTRPSIPPEIRVHTFSQDDMIGLTILDNGVGIDLERHGSQLFKFRKIFNRGYNSKGVGLFLIRQQIESHGGTIDVESTPGRGTAFTVRFFKQPVN